jgi:four helix bundle protein
LKYNRDIKEWTLDFSISIIKLSMLLKKEKIDFDVIDQVRRSGTSVGANVHEAKSSISRKEMIKYYAIALKSANETYFWFEVIEKGYNFNNEALTKCWDDLKQIEKIVAKIILNLKEKPSV